MTAGKTVDGVAGAAGVRWYESERRTRERRQSRGGGGWDVAGVAVGVPPLRQPPTPLPSRMAPRSPTSSSCSVAAVGLSECATNTLRRIGLRRSVVPQCYGLVVLLRVPIVVDFVEPVKKEEEKRVGGRGCSA